MSEHFPSILKLAPGRHERRLKLIRKGHVELNSFTPRYGRGRRELVRWGLLERLPTVHLLDDYDGLRPTKLGAPYFIHEQEFHLLLVRKEKVDELRERSKKAVELELEATLVATHYEVQLARANGSMPADGPMDPAWEAQRQKVKEGYQRRGYTPIRIFAEQHDLGYDDLITAGVYRYVEPRKGKPSGRLVIVAKAKDCFLLSTRWQLVLIKPGMERRLLEQCAVELRLL